MLTKIGVALGSVITLATLLGFGFAVESHYAKEAPTAMAFEEVRADLMMVSNRIDAMKLEDELLLVKKKLFGLEDRWGEKFKTEHGRYHQSIEELLAFMPKEYRDEYRSLSERKEKLEKQIEEKNKKKEEGT